MQIQCCFSQLQPREKKSSKRGIKEDFDDYLRHSGKRNHQKEEKRGF